MPPSPGTARLAVPGAVATDALVEANEMVGAAGPATAGAATDFPETVCPAPFVALGAAAKAAPGTAAANTIPSATNTLTPRRRRETSSARESGTGYDVSKGL
jgi:hypothetical protein